MHLVSNLKIGKQIGKQSVFGCVSSLDMHDGCFSSSYFSHLRESKPFNFFELKVFDVTLAHFELHRLLFEMRIACLSV